MKYFLTFDGAPHSPHTERILDILDRYGVKATFFVEGHRVRANEELLRRIVREGHALGNHGFSHRVLADLSVEEILEEIEHCSREIERVTGIRVRAFRPPWGKISVDAVEALVEKGYVPVCWNASVRDFSLKEAKELADRLCQCRCDYAVPVLHDAVEIVPQALEQAIPELLQSGATFETIDEYV